MIVLENKDFIEGVFAIANEAEEYLLNHPDKDSCIVKEIKSEQYPLFIIEPCRGKFIYFSTKVDLLNHLSAMEMSALEKHKKTTFYIGENGERETIETKEQSFILYIIREPYVSTKINTDEMGMIEHYHINEDDLKMINDTKILEIVGIN
jgi:hypothetical protein